MRLPSYQWIGQMLAASGVIFSLALVAYELKLTRDTAKADIYQQSAAMLMEYQSSGLANESLQDAREQVFENIAEASKREILLYTDHLDGWMWQKEAQYYQYQIGMSDDTEWSNHQRNIREMAVSPCYRYTWNTWGKYMVRDDFAAEVERIWAEIPETDCPL